MPTTKQKATPSSLHAAVNKQFGAGSIGFASDPSLQITRIPTGIISLDYVLNGGWARGRHSELYGEFCVTPDTKILTSDLIWTPAGDLLPDEELVGFDENLRPGGQGNSTKMWPSQVERQTTRRLPCVRIVTDKGEITCSLDHPLVARNSSNMRVWKLAEDIEVGSTLIWTAEPWKQLATRDSGYAAGLLDGEGWMTDWRVCFGQNPGTVLDEGILCLKRLGFDVNVHQQSGNNCMAVRTSGGRWKALELLGSVRPYRLLEKAPRLWIGGDMTSKGRFTVAGQATATVLAVEAVGRKDVVALQTSTRTYISNGFASHNSVGKTLVALMSIAMAQELGLNCAFMDVEKTFDPVFAQHHGVNLKKLSFPLRKRRGGEEIIDIIEAHLYSGDFDLIVMDSIAALLPNAEQEASIAKASMGTYQARLMSKAMRKLTAANQDTTLLYINQLRDSLSMFVPEPVTSGGRAMGFYSGSRVKFQKAETIKTTKQVFDARKMTNVQKEIVTGHRALLTITKDKTGSQPFDETTFVYDYDSQKIDEEEMLIYLGRRLNIIKGAGKPEKLWLSFEPSKKYIGRKGMKKMLLTDDVRREKLLDKIIGE